MFLLFCLIIKTVLKFFIKKDKRIVSNIKALCLLIITTISISGCRFWDRSMQEIMNDPFDHENSMENAPVHYTTQAPLATPRSIIVCRSKQCAPIKLSMSTEYIYNSLAQMMKNNNNNRALICAADAGSHSCYQNYISLPITVGITPAYMYIDSVKITDVSINKGSNSINIMLNYNVTYNGQTPDCTPDKTLLYVKNAENIVLEDKGYRCKMTTIGNTTIKTMFLIDFIDLDYGFIGGYYSIGLSGPSYGGGSGYMLLRLPETGYPLMPMPAKEQTPAQQHAQSYLEGNNADTSSTAAGTDGVQVFPINYKK